MKINSISNLLMTVFIIVVSSTALSQEKKQTKIKLDKNQTLLKKDGIPEHLLEDLIFFGAREFNLKYKNNYKAFSCLVPDSCWNDINFNYTNYYKRKGFFIYVINSELIDSFVFLELLILKANDFIDIFKYHDVVKNMSSDQISRIASFFTTEINHLNIYSVTNNKIFHFYFHHPLDSDVTHFISQDIYDLSDYKKERVNEEDLLVEIKRALEETGGLVLQWDEKQ
jgi:hypothetical protein